VQLAGGHSARGRWVGGKGGAGRVNE
jgi:hypothetical protein